MSEIFNIWTIAAFIVGVILAAWVKSLLSKAKGAV